MPLAVSIMHYLAMDSIPCMLCQPISLNSDSIHDVTQFVMDTTILNVSFASTWNLVQAGNEYEMNK